ncbi:MAG: hypothetical protein ACE5ES_00875 [Candidatus Nanoarchaeia archaeon]
MVLQTALVNLIVELPSDYYIWLRNLAIGIKHSEMETACISLEFILNDLQR